MGRRTVAPRLSGQWEWHACESTPKQGRILPEIQCGAPESAAATACNVDRPADAIRALVRQSACTDKAVAALAELAERNPSVLNDLAGAYYIRAHRNDRPRDLFRAYEAVQRAWRATPDDPAVLFNRALIEESLGLPASWDAVPADGTEWKTEARRRQALRGPGDSAAQWRAIETQLNTARDGDAVAKLIAPFPGLAQRHLETMVRRPGTDLEAAQTLAVALFHRTGDRFGLDLVEARRTNQRAPFELLEQYGAATLELDPAKSLAMLQPLRATAEQRNYHHLLARIDVARTNSISHQGRFLESLDRYDKAAETLTQLGDHDLLAGTLARRAGVLRTAGDVEGATGDLLRALRYAPRLATGKELQNVFGEAGRIAERLDGLDLALRYQEVVIAFYRRIIGETSPANLQELESLQQQLAIALYNRARITTQLGRLPSALKDLEDAAAYKAAQVEQQSTIIDHWIRTRLEEVKGQTLLSIDRPGAVKAFTRALELAADDEFHTYKASLYMQRAQAGHQDAEGDYRRAVEEIEQEEALMLKERLRGNGEELWPGYFARFQEAYRSLIRYQWARGNRHEAFRLMERARAREPRDLLMQVAPQALRGLERGTVDEIQQALPAGTWLLEYCVFGDRTYVWRIARHELRTAELPVGSEQIERWSKDLRDAAKFDAGLDAPYRHLLQPVLPPGGPETRLVIVPDGAMHGLPFAGLRNDANKRHLMQDYILESAPSAALYVSALTRNHELQNGGELSILALGNPSIEGGAYAELGNLPYAEVEATDIGAQYARSTVLTGKAATKEALLRLARTSDILHAATHAVVMPETPAQSMLLLASGPLTAKELVRDLQLDRTRLVVLSSCSSAGGLPVGPEGVAPLVRPILTAGVPAVIGSLRKVPDNPTTRELFVSFHAEYRKRRDAAKALQAAQQRMLGDPSAGFHSALSWAPFQVIGHNAPTHHNDKGEPP